MADHFERVGDARQAVQFHQLAAQDSTRRYATREAVLHLHRALKLVPGLPRADAIEAEILSELGKVLPAIQGFGDPNLLALFMRTRRLQSAGADASSELSTITGLVLANLMQRRSEAAEELARELIGMNCGDLGATAHADGELLMGAVRYHRGDLVDSIEHVQRSIASAPAGLMLGPIDYHSNTLTILAPAMWQVGRPDDGLSRAREAVEHARRCVDPFNLVTALISLAAVYHWCGDAVHALTAARELAARSREQGIAETEACSELTEAWVLHMGGEREKALGKVKLGIAALRQHGSMMQWVYLLTVAVEVLLASGRRSEAADRLDEARRMIEDGAARWWEPEIYRWKAVLLGLEDGANVDEAESYLRRACDLAAQQGSNSLNLRAALNLADLWLRRGRDRDAKEFVEAALRDVHGGVDTRDVRVAREWIGLRVG